MTDQWAWDVLKDPRTSAMKKADQAIEKETPQDPESRLDFLTHEAKFLLTEIHSLSRSTEAGLDTFKGLMTWIRTTDWDALDA